MKTSKNNRSASSGFTLVEVLIASMILGMCIVAAMASIQASTSATIAGTEMTQAVILAQGLREWTMNLPFIDPDGGETTPGPNGASPTTWVDDLNDLLNFDGNGTTYSPPAAPDGVNIYALDALPNWSETVTLTWRDPADIGTVVANGASDVVYVSVTIRKDGEEILTTGWIITNRED